MANFILNRKISVDKYQFPAGAFKIYGDGKFYNGFAIGALDKLTVVNEEGVLKFSRGAAESQYKTSVILGNIPPNNKASIYIDVAAPLSETMNSAFLINNSGLYTEKWLEAKVYNTTGYNDTTLLQAGGELAIYFQAGSPLSAIPNLCSVRAIWAL